MSEGGKCRTPWLELDNFFRNDFEAGRKDIFNVDSDDVGLPQVIGLSTFSMLETFGDEIGYIISNLVFGKCKLFVKARYVLHSIQTVAQHEYPELIPGAKKKLRLSAYKIIDWLF